MKYRINTLFACAPLCVILVTGLLLAGCGDLFVGADDTDDEEEPQVEVSASFTIDPDEPEVGDEVILDASGSTVTGADDLVYSWSLSVPEHSEASLQNPQAEITSFTADSRGDYEISLQVSAGGKSDVNDTAVEVVFPDAPFSEDCTELNPENVEIEQFGDDQWRLVDGDKRILVFDDFENAKKARDTIKFYGFTESCFVGRPNPPMTYWLQEGAPPRAVEDTPFEEDCITLDPESVEVEQFGDDQWRLVAGSSALLVFDELDNAKKARDTIQFYGFTSICFVQRPNPPLQYWLR